MNQLANNLGFFYGFVDLWQYNPEGSTWYYQGLTRESILIISGVGC